MLVAGAFVVAAFLVGIGLALLMIEAVAWV
jgi:hypothetical protein